MSSNSEKKEVGKVDVSQFTAMSVAEARSTIWPFKGIRKPIGALLESGEVTIRDIAWASENAYDSHLKQAAKTILISRLFPEKVGEPLKPAQSISGTNYTSYQRRRTLAIGSLLMGGFIGFGLFFFLIWVLSYFLKVFAEYRDLISTVFGITFLFVVPLILVWFGSDYLNQSESYAIGEDAENQAMDSFRSLLHEPWTIVHNFEFPSRKWGDIDLILVGTGGMWAIEVKGYTNQIRNIGDSWHFKNRFGWWKLSKHPGRQARRNAQRLKTYLDKEGINVKWVEAVVLWAGEESNLTVEKPETPVWKISELPTMEEFWKNQKLNVEQVSQVVMALQSAIDQTKKKKSN